MEHHFIEQQSHALNIEAQNHKEEPFKFSNGVVKLHASLSAMNLAASQAVESVGKYETVGPQFSAGDMSTLMVLQQEQKKEEESQRKQKLFFTELTSEQSDKKGLLGGEHQTPVTEKNAVFMTGSLLDNVQEQQDKSLVSEQSQMLQVMEQKAEVLQLAIFLAEVLPSIQQDKREIAHWLEVAMQEQGGGGIVICPGLGAFLEAAVYELDLEVTLAGLFAGYSIEEKKNPDFILTVLAAFKFLEQKFPNLDLSNPETVKKVLARMIESMEELDQLIELIQGKGADAIFKMQSMLIDLQRIAVKTNADRMKQQQKIAEATIKGLQASNKKIQQALEKYAQAQRDKPHSIWGWICDFFKLLGHALEALGEAVAAAGAGMVGQTGTMDKLMSDAHKLGKKMIENPAMKIVGDVMMVVMTVAAMAAGQFVLAGLMAALFIANVTGGEQDLTKALAKAFGSKLAADIFMLYAVTLLSVGVGSLAAGAEEGVEDAAVEMAEEGAEEGAQEGAQTAAKDSAEEGIGTKVKRAVGRIGKAIGPKVGAGLVGFGSTLGSSSIGEDLAKAIDKKDEKTFEIIQEVLSALAAIAGGLGVSAGVESATGKAGSGIARALAKRLDKSVASIVSTAYKMEVAAMAISSLASIGQGAEQMRMADLLEKLGDLKAYTGLFEQTHKVAESEIKQLNDHLKNLMKEYEHIVDTFNAPALSGQGIARALMQAV